jgi:hypothetical protein
MPAVVFKEPEGAMWQFCVGLVLGGTAGILLAALLVAFARRDEASDWIWSEGARGRAGSHPATPTVRAPEGPERSPAALMLIKLWVQPGSRAVRAHVTQTVNHIDHEARTQTVSGRDGLLTLVASSIDEYTYHRTVGRAARTAS